MSLNIISNEKLAQLEAAAELAGATATRSALLELQHYRSLSADPRVVAVRKRHKQSRTDIANNFGAAYSSRINQDKFSLHEDRALLLSLFPETKETA